MSELIVIGVERTGEIWRCWADPQKLRHVIRVTRGNVCYERPFSFVELKRVPTASRQGYIDSYCHWMREQLHEIEQRHGGTTNE